MNVYYIDLSDITTRQALFRCLNSALPFPSEGAGNLDALHDLLTEYGAGWDVMIYNTEMAADSLGPWFDRFRKMCIHSMEETPGLRICLYP